MSKNEDLIKEIEEYRAKEQDIYIFKNFLFGVFCGAALVLILMILIFEVPKWL